MKFFLFIITIFAFAVSCSSTRTLSETMEDDIYYIPGKKPLVVQEVENITGQDIATTQAAKTPTGTYANETYSRSSGSSIAPSSFSSDKSSVINRSTGQLDQISTAELATEAQRRLEQSGSVNETVYQNTGYWIGGFKGSESDLDEIQRIINQYPDGFGYIANGQDIALNLSFSSDWNVYTDEGRYWWFPSNTNINLYSSLLFGTYPKYIWTVVWDNPRYDSWAFDSGFNSGFNLGISSGWGGSGWSFGFGWNSGYRPYYGGWYGGWNDPWWNPYWGNGWYGNHYWNNHYWHDHHWNGPHWGGGNYPSWGPPSERPGRPIAGTRPGTGGGVTGIRPGNTSRPGNVIRPGTSIRPGASTRPGTTTTRPSGVTRPGTSSMTRPGSSTTTRPGTSVTRPGSSTTQPTTRPGGITTRPNTSVTRPGTSNPTTRPSGNTTTTRPGSAVTRPSSGNQNTRPAAPQSPPGSYTRPTTSPSSSYTRPAGSSGSNSSSGSVKNYSRPQNDYRPTYNNSTTRYNSGSSYTPSRSSSGGSSGGGSSYTPSRSSGSSGGGGGGVSRPTSPSRPTRR